MDITLADDRQVYHRAHFGMRSKPYFLYDFQKCIFLANITSGSLQYVVNNTILRRWLQFHV